MKLVFAALALGFSLTSATAICPTYDFEVFKATSHSRSGLKPTVDNFRHILGGPDNGNEPGPLRKGQRSINWDAPVIPFNMPFDFFQLRGVIFDAKLKKFAVSNPPDHSDDKFDSINSGAAKDFIDFSPKRLFTPVLDNKITTFFTIPGSKKPAAVSGFGAVFVDVDRRDTSYMTFKDRHGCKIAKIAVPPRSNGLSFVGVIVKGVQVRHSHKYAIVEVKAPIAKVNMNLGNKAIVNKKYRGNVVVMDDFIFGEPQAH